jgi:hypothetical protein
VFFPTVAEIRGAASDIELEQSGLPTAYEAREMAQRPKKDLPDIVKKVMYAIGTDFYDLQRSQNIASDRASFLGA